MARNRMIKPDFWDDEKMATISRDARLTYIAIWNFSDDYGVVKGHHSWLKNNIYPYDDKLTVGTFEKWLSELESLNRIVPFFANNEIYYYLPKFLTHQYINRPSKNRNPEPPNDILCNVENSQLTEDSDTTHGGLTDEIELELELEREIEIESRKGIYCRVIANLNAKTGKNFKANSRETKTLIKARIDAGFTEQDFYTVIDNKTTQWLSDPKMINFLRPQTLFGTKFESYLQDIPHPLQDKVSAKTIKNIEILKNWRPKNEESGAF